MSVTNAISGLTAAGGLLCVGGGIVPYTIPQFLAAVAVMVSSFNIAGGFIVTQRMLDMFKRPNDPPEYNYMYLGAGATFVGAYLMSHLAGIPNVYQACYLASSLCCIAAICGLSTQPTARLGNMLGISGVSGGMITTLAYLGLPPAQFFQAIALIGLGGAAGYYIGANVAVTDLPQTVALFHSLVGLAAVTTSISSYMSTTHADLLHVIAAFLGVFIGGVTFTGSLAAYRKLANLWGKMAMNLPLAKYLNLPICAINTACLIAMIAMPEATGLGVASLTQCAITSSILGWNITNNIGAADMPVAITVLNSYSGWALCAEGFMLNNNLLTIVGSLIGSSGAILTYIMCEAMNRSITNVIFGSYADLGTGK